MIYEFELSTVLVVFGTILYATYIFKRLSALATISKYELAVLHIIFFLPSQLIGRLLDLHMYWMFVLHLVVGMSAYLILFRRRRYGVLSRRGFLRLVCLGKMHGLMVNEISDLSNIDVLVVNPSEFEIGSNSPVGIDPLLKNALKLGINIETITEFLKEEYGFIEINRHISASQVVLVKKTMFFFVKTILEKVIAAALLIILSPLLVIVILLVWAKSGLPIFFWQERVGLNGKLFHIWKFRTYSVDGAKIGNLGKFLRASHIDELPQLVNVLSGEMALLGPRPEWAKLTTAELAPADYWIRRTIKPGISGWAQVNYRPSLTRYMRLKKLGYDIYYINNVSIFLDGLIWLRTISNSLSYYVSLIAKL